MTPSERLEKLLAKAEKKIEQRAVKSAVDAERIQFICRYTDNRAPVRLFMACLLAKLDNPAIDPRKPYTAIGGDDCFSGRSYDEAHLTSFITRNRLPCNSTTAFLTPAFRNFNQPLTIQVVPVGRPKELYTRLFQVLDVVASGSISAEAIFVDTLRILLAMRNERVEQLEGLLGTLRQRSGPISISSEMIVTLIEQHLACRASSRLPVLMVAAAYDAVGSQLGEFRKSLHSHNAADEQTGALGDVEIAIVNDEQVRTVYEMKSQRVTAEDIDRAIQKLGGLSQRVDNYLFVTTEAIESTVEDYAKSQYAKTGCTEVAVVDCVGFLRHFLHFFHRYRIEFLDAYQDLVLAEADSAVSLPLKSALLSLRQAAETEA